MRLKKSNPQSRTGVPLLSWGRKKLSARKDVQDLVKDMDPASCGPPVQTAVVPEVILRLNDENKKVAEATEGFDRAWLH